MSSIELRDLEEQFLNAQTNGAFPPGTSLDTLLRAYLTESLMGAIGGGGSAGSSLGPQVLTVAASGAQYTTIQAALAGAITAGGWASSDTGLRSTSVVLTANPLSGDIIDFSQNIGTGSSPRNPSGIYQFFTTTDPTSDSIIGVQIADSPADTASALADAIGASDPGSDAEQPAVNGNTITMGGSAWILAALAPVVRSASGTSGAATRIATDTVGTAYQSANPKPIVIMLPAGTYTENLDLLAGNVTLFAMGAVTINGTVTAEANAPGIAASIVLQGEFTTGATSGSVTNQRATDTADAVVHTVAELQNALAAGMLNIRLAGGTYNLGTTQVVVPAGVTLSSLGRSATLSGQTVVELSGANCTLSSLRIVNMSAGPSSGVIVKGSGCRILDCEITCNEWCINPSVAVSDLIVDHCTLKGINPFYPEGELTDCYFTNNIGWFNQGVAECHALLDMCNSGSNSSGVVVANNEFYFERSSIQPAAGTIVGGGGMLSYFVHLSGWGHTVVDNVVRYTVDCKGSNSTPQPIAGPKLVQFFSSATPTISVIDRETLIEGNVIDMYFKNMAGDFSSAPKACSLEQPNGGQIWLDGPATFKNNACYLSGTTYASNNATAQTLTAMVPGINTQLTASMPMVTIYPDGLFGATVAGANFSATGYVANLNIPTPLPPAYATASGTTAAYLLAAFGDPRLLGKGWTGVVNVSGTRYNVYSDGANFYYTAAVTYTEAS